MLIRKHFPLLLFIAGIVQFINIIFFNSWLNPGFNQEQKHETIIDAPVNIALKVDEKQQCEDLVNSAASADPGEMNRLRRRLAIEDPTCYRRSYSTFARNFRSRLKQVTSHLHLHIPKAGGTSLCEMAGLHKETTNMTNNCWVKRYFQPVWCCCNFTEREGLFDSNNNTKCDVYRDGEESLFPEFVMNENYLDYPLCLTHRIYSITLRNPVDRAMSNERHLTGFRSNKHNKPMSNETFSEKLNLIRHNYITWALSAGGMAESQRFSFVPQKEELTTAKDAISRLDFLIDFSRNDTCNNAIFNLMGLGSSSIGHARRGTWRQFQQDLKPKSQYHEWNLLDLELYKYSEQLMDVDCEFFLQLTGESALSELSSAVNDLVSPATAAARLQDPLWIVTLVHKLYRTSPGKRRRILEWTVKNPPSNGIELLLMPFQFRSSLLIDLILDGRVMDTMGENIAMMGWAKAVLALGCKRVLMFESYVDFVDHLDKSVLQFYVMDHISLPMLKDELLLDPLLKQRTWEFHWWGRNEETVEKLLNITPEYGYQIDHTLIPFNFTKNIRQYSERNMRMSVLPTAITFNHWKVDATPQLCDVFYMGKSVVNIENVTNVVKLVDEKLSENDTPVQDFRLCTAFKIPSNSSYEKVLGFKPKYTANTGRMEPPVFAHLVGNSKVVVGSGWPKVSPTIVDAIFGGAIFMAPTDQFMSMEMHPLFIHTEKSFNSPEEQANKIISILRDGERNQLPFGGYKNTSYTLEHACGRLLKVIQRSFLVE